MASTITCAVLIITLGSSHAALGQGAAVAWGANNAGQCIVTLQNDSFIAIAGGTSHSLGLKADGSIVGWGDNGWGQLNIPTPNTGFIKIAAGEIHGLGLLANGSIVAWGGNSWGECNVAQPNSDFVAVAAGDHTSYGLKSDGSIRAWGYNGNGQCNVPEPNTDYIAVSGGTLHGLGLKSDGSIVAWGSNAYGQCDVPSPNSDFVAIAVGNGHSLGLKSNGSIAAWGRNNAGQCDVPAPNADFVAIASAGNAYHNIGLKSDGTPVAWGSNQYYQCSVPLYTEFYGVAAGANHSLGLRTAPSPDAFILLPPGTFTMGSPLSEPGRLSDEVQHTVTLTHGFYMSNHEVTEALWLDVMGIGQWSRFPMRRVSWDMAVQFCNELSIREGLTPAYTVHGANGDVDWNRAANGYRLPTEAEWEYACRAGSSTAFPTGPITDLYCGLDPILNLVGWYCGNSGGDLKEIGGKQANAWGLEDMAGSVWEWIWDGYRPDYEQLPPDDPDFDPGVGALRAFRGGSWLNNARNCRSAARDGGNWPTSMNPYAGFRIVRTADGGHAATPPVAPMDLAATVSGPDTIVVSWTDVADNETAFELERKTSSTGAWNVVTHLPANLTAWTDAGLLAGQEHFYRVRARNSGGYSQYSNMARATAGVVLGAATITSVTEVPEGVLITWDPPPGPKVGYRIRRTSLAGKDIGTRTEWSIQPPASATQAIDRDHLPDGPQEYVVWPYDVAATYAISTPRMINIQSTGQRQRTIRVTRNGAPMPGASIFAGSSNATMTYRDKTNSNGELVLYLSKGDLVTARLDDVFAMHTGRPSHGSVDERRYTLSLDSDSPTGKGHLHTQYKVREDDTIIPLKLQHPQYRYNIIAASTFSMPANDTDMPQLFQQASNYLYTASDGYIMLGKVRFAADAGADIQRNADVLYIDQVRCRRGKSSHAHRENDNWSTACDPVAESDCIDKSVYIYWDNGRRSNETLAQSGNILAHELMHTLYAVSDEYVYGDRNNTDRPLAQNLPLQEMFSYNWHFCLHDFGLMDRNKNVFSGTRHQPFLSTADDYKNFASNDPMKTTSQYAVRKHSVWETVKACLAADLGRGSAAQQLPGAIGYLTLFMGGSALDRSTSVEEAPDIDFAYVALTSKERSSVASDVRKLPARLRAMGSEDETLPLVDIELEGSQSQAVLRAVIENMANGLEQPMVSLIVDDVVVPISVTAGTDGTYIIEGDLSRLLKAEGVSGKLAATVTDSLGGSHSCLTYMNFDVGAGPASEAIAQWPASFGLNGPAVGDSTVIVTWATTTDCGETCGNNIGTAFCGIAATDATLEAGQVSVSFLFDSTRNTAADSLAIVSWDRASGRWQASDSTAVIREYGYVLGRHNGMGLFALRTNACVRDSLAPVQVANLVAMQGLGAGNIDIDWNPGHETTTGAGPRSFHVAWSDSIIDEGNWYEQHGTTIRQWAVAQDGHFVSRVTASHAGKQLYLAMRAVDDAGNLSPVSDNCRVTSGYIDANLVPAPPTAFVAEDNPMDCGGAIRLRWRSSVDDGGGKETVCGYKIFRKDRLTNDSGLIAEPAAGITSYLDVLASAGRLYDYWISAVDSIQESDSQREFAAACADSGSLAGDFSSDASVDLRDLALLAPHLGVSADSTRYDVLYDVTSDDRIDEEDAAFVVAAFGSGLPVVNDPAGDNAAARLVLKVSYGANDSTTVDVCVSGAKNLAGYSFALAFPGAESRLLGTMPYDGILSGASLTSRGAWAPLRTVDHPEPGLLHMARVVTDPDETLAASGTAWLERIVFSGKDGIDLTMSGAAVIDCKNRVNVLAWEVTSVSDGDVPGATVLFQSRPNPFNGMATIQYRISRRGQVNVAIYDLRGRKVRQLVQEAQVAGDYTVSWDAKDGQGRSVASGCYLCKMITEDYDQTHKVMLVK